MHPIFGRASRLASYLAVWILGGVLVGGVLTKLEFGWIEALAWLLPLFLVYAFACLSAWYICRAFPLRSTSLLTVFATSRLAALTASALWNVIARTLIAGLNGLPLVAGSPAQYEQQLPLLFAVGVFLFLIA